MTFISNRLVAVSQNIFHENLKNDLAEIERLSQLISDFASRHHINAKATYHIYLVLDELLTNTINHGQANDISVSAHYDDPILTITIKDNGQAFNPLKDTQEPDLDASLEDRAIGGLGVHFAKNFMDQLSYKRDGQYNHLTLTLNTAQVT